MKIGKKSKGETLKKKERVILLAIKGWTSQLTLLFLKGLGLERLNMNHHHYAHYVVKSFNDPPECKAGINLLNFYKCERGCEQAW